MIQHLCLINYKQAVDAATEQTIIEAYNRLPALIPGIKNFRVGPDAGLLQGNCDLGIVAEFDSKEDFQNYSVHPAHAEVIFPVLGELMESYYTAQFEV